MSTLLTPIIAQIDIDRERFKQLVNGGVDDTVQLEFRIEKSIAGMVKERIDELAYTLEQAVTSASDSATTAESAVGDVEGIKDDIEGIRDEITGISNDVRNEKDEVQNISINVSNKAEEVYGIYESIMDLDANKYSLSMATPIHPVERYDSGVEPIEIPYNKNDFFMMASLPISPDDSNVFQNRTFEIVKMDEGFDGNVSDDFDEDKNYTVVRTDVAVDDSLYIGEHPSDLSAWYAWRSIDLYNNRNPDIEPTSISSYWTLYKIDDSSPYVTRPSISISTVEDKKSPAISISGGDVNNISDSISHTNIVIYDTHTNAIVYTKLLEGKQSSHTIDGDILYDNKEYKVKVQYVIIKEEGNIYSPFSEYIEFDTKVNSAYLPYYHTKSKSITSVIDVEDSTVYRVDASVDRTLTLSKPSLGSDVAASLVIFIEDSGGTITWPAEISWSGGSEPVLGTSWTNVILFWTGSMWIGMEGAKR